MDYHELRWIIFYHELKNIPGPPKAEAVTTAKRYGAGMAHTTPSRRHELSWFMYHRR
jgi:hypothetical protein